MLQNLFDFSISSRRYSQPNTKWLRTGNSNNYKPSSPFRSDVEVVDIVTFLRTYMHRQPGEEQIKAYLAIWGDDPHAIKWDKTYNEIVLLVGMKGGKNYWAEGDIAYLCYIISCMRDPHQFFTEVTETLVPYPKDKNFDIVNVSSVDEKQARNAFFQSAKQAIRNTIDPKTGKNWFETYIGLDMRESVGAFKEKEIIFPTKDPGTGGIRILSFSSVAKAPEGLHILRFYADELSRADTKATYKKAVKLYDLGLNNTLVSFPNNVGKTLGWSYTNDTDFDLTNERYELSKIISTIYAVKLATWDFNPSRTRAMFAKAYEADEKKAMCVFECIKPISKDNFYHPYTEKIRQAISYDINNKIEYRLYTNVRQVNGGEKTFTGVEVIDIIGDNRERCFGFDAGKSKDSFVIVGGYNETVDPLKISFFIGDQTEVIHTNKRQIIDIMIVIKPQKSKPVDYIDVSKVFSALIKAFPNTQSINSDQWQNEKLRQEILNKGIRAETIQFSNAKQIDLYRKMRANVWQNNIQICNDTHEGHKTESGTQLVTPSELWVLEGEKLIDMGTKIDHPNGGSKDAQDATAIVVNDLMQLEANGSITTTLDNMPEKELRLLAMNFADAEYELRIDNNYTEEEITMLLRGKFKLSDNEFNKLNQFVRENYGY